jgi:pimeloyl-ACP methyl ester carboxylesterase
VSSAPTVPIVLESEHGAHRIEGELGHLEVPVRHRQPNGPRWRLAWVRLPAVTSAPGAPIVMLAGGPGGSGIEALRYEDEGWLDFWLGLRSLGDVIALDQRGTGWSHPVPESLERWDLPLDEPGDPETYHRVAAEGCRRLRDRWLERGVDVGGFTTEESADDIELLRQALGADRLRLVGASYGSHLALSVIRRHGDSVERAALALVEGPDHTYKLPSRVQAALELYADLAGDDDALGGQVQDLVGLIGELLGELRERPVSIVVDGERVVVGAYDLQHAIAGCVGDQRAIRMLPARLLRLRRGDAGWLGRVTLEHRRRWIGSAMYWHTDAASGATADRRRRIAAETPATLLADVINHPFPRIEQAWECPDLGEEFRSPLESPVPVQFQSGFLDGRTPPANVDDILPGFPNAGHLVVDGVAHDEAFVVAAVRDAVTTFLAGGEPSSGRLAAPFAFARSDEVEPHIG